MQHEKAVVANWIPFDGFCSAVERNAQARISRGKDQIWEGKIASLKRFNDDAKEVKAGYECGLVFENFGGMQELDIVEAYKMVEVPRS